MLFFAEVEPKIYGTDGKLAYLFSIGWFVPSNLGSKKFLSVQMQCAHTDSMCCAYKVLVSTPLATGFIL